MLQNQNGENVVGDTLEDLAGVDAGAFDGLPEGETNQFSDLPNTDKPAEAELTGKYLEAYDFFCTGLKFSVGLITAGTKLARMPFVPAEVLSAAGDITASSFVQLAKEYKKAIVLLQQNGITPPDSKTDAYEKAPQEVKDLLDRIFPEL